MRTQCTFTHACVHTRTHTLPRRPRLLHAQPLLPLPSCNQSPGPGTRHHWQEHDPGATSGHLPPLCPTGTSHLATRPSGPECPGGNVPVTMQGRAQGRCQTSGGGVGLPQDSHSPGAWLPRPSPQTAAPNLPPTGGLTSGWRSGRPGCWRRGGGTPPGSWLPAALWTARTRPPGCPGCAGRRTRT